MPACDRVIRVLSRSKKAAVAGKPHFGGRAGLDGDAYLPAAWVLKPPESMAPPRSRLVTWSYSSSKLLWNGSGVRTRTWTVRRPPLSPPAGVAPFAGAGCPCSRPFWPLRHRPRKPLARGPSPRNPHVRGRALGTTDGVSWREGWRSLGAKGALCWARLGVLLVVGRLRCGVLQFHRFGFTD